MANPKVLMAATFLLGFHSVGWAQQNESPAADSRSEAWKAYYKQRAESDYKLVWTQEELPLVLRPQAIVNWTNPLEKGQINGSTFVWEFRGRPVVVGQLFSYLTDNGKRSFCHVFSTLSDEPVVARRNGKVFWRPRLPDSSGWHVLKSAPAVAESRSGRLRQMRGLARQISSYTEEASRGKRNLRLLSQPLYRTDVSTTDRDGGLFAYVVGTDPELLLLIDCDLSEDTPVWRYRFAQSTRSTTVAILNNQEIYRYSGPGSDPQSQEAVYLSRHGVEVIPGEFE